MNNCATCNRERLVQAMVGRSLSTQLMYAAVH
jgi:hypothetical protein